MKERPLPSIVGGIAPRHEDLTAQRVTAGVVEMDTEHGQSNVVPHFVDSLEQPKCWSLSSIHRPLPKDRSNREKGIIVGGIARFSGELYRQKVEGGVVVYDSSSGYVDTTRHFTQSQALRSYWSRSPLKIPRDTSERHTGC